MESNHPPSQEESNFAKPQNDLSTCVDKRESIDGSKMSIAFQNLGVHAYVRSAGYQYTVSNFPVVVMTKLAHWFSRTPKLRVDILHGFDGIVSSGEMLLVLGNPGSGCTTLLKSLAGQTHDIIVDEKSTLNYQGLSSQLMSTEFRGHRTYQAETDVHFPTLTLRETLEVAYKARHPPRSRYDCSSAIDSLAETLGLTKALDTKIGNALLPGISGGERKRASIAEILLGDSTLQCWDNSTRGLDSTNALEFIKALRQRTTESGSVAIVTLYQASEDIYKLFDKVTVLFEGRQIYFGSTESARKYFEDLGFIASARSTTPEFLTSVTRPLELRPATTNDVGPPLRSAADFAAAWKASSEHRSLISKVESYNEAHPLGDDTRLLSSRRDLKGTEKKCSAYILTIPQQASLCIDRGFLRLKNNLSVPISTIMGNLVTSIILGSMFYNMPENTDSFFGRGVLLFFTSLVNTTLAAFESVELWDDRPIVEKHVQYGFYHALSEAIASFACDLPRKIALTFVFNFPLYFLSNLRRTAGAFFTYYLFGFMSLLNGSMIYRSMGAMSRTLAGSQPPGAVFVMLLTIYSGFVVPFRDMRPWLQWFSYINPVYYAFESMVINEFSGREFPCASFLPEQHEGSSFVCSSVGAEPGQSYVTGDSYVAAKFGFQREHLWRNLGISFALLTLFSIIYVLATEFITMLPPRSDVPIFQRGHGSTSGHSDEECHQSYKPGTGKEWSEIEHKDLDHVGISNEPRILWSGLTYDIKDGKSEKRILDNIDGWVKPGTLTALMGPSGAGKTTLLNVLAERATIGVVTGKKVVGTRYKNIGFARKIGYAQQDDIHLDTASVRESFTFSALLRQPPHYSRKEKLAYVDHVIEILDLQELQHAVVGKLNVEQRKRVTIGVEMSARPELLLFLDEPTSGLDSDSSWAFCTLIRRLTRAGQAILCTIHQPSSPLLTHFDRLLFLREGQTIYFGDFGHECNTLIKYFEANGARKCLPHENPADWMMEVTKKQGDADQQDWATTWNNSQEHAAVKAECDESIQRLSKVSSDQTHVNDSDTEFATSFWYQLGLVTKRAFKHDWRSPEYLYSKSLTTFGCSFINGVSFWASGNTSQDVQNQIFSLFLLTTIFGTHVQLIMERFYHSRTLYENRERQSRTYTWLVFLISAIIVELASQTVIAVIAYVSWYYPLGLWRNALNQHELNSRSGLVFLLIWSLLILFQTLSQMLMTIMPDIPAGINMANLFFMLSLIFTGVLVPPSALTKFWIWMYRATPLSYYISAIMSTGLSGMRIDCTSNDILRLDPPSNETCGSYLSSAAAVVLNQEAVESCEVCLYTTADALLSYFGIYFDDRWWQWGVTVAFNVINIALAILLYWLVRVPKGAKSQ